MSSETRRQGHDDEPRRDDLPPKDDYESPRVDDIPVDRPAVTDPGFTLLVQGSPDPDN